MVPSLRRSSTCFWPSSSFRLSMMGWIQAHLLAESPGRKPILAHAHHRASIKDAHLLLRPIPVLLLLLVVERLLFAPLRPFPFALPVASSAGVGGCCCSRLSCEPRRERKLRRAKSFPCRQAHEAHQRFLIAQERVHGSVLFEVLALMPRKLLVRQRLGVCRITRALPPESMETRVSFPSSYLMT